RSCLDDVWCVGRHLEQHDIEDVVDREADRQPTGFGDEYGCRRGGSRRQSHRGTGVEYAHDVAAKAEHASHGDGCVRHHSDGGSGDDLAHLLGAYGPLLARQEEGDVLVAGHQALTAVSASRTSATAARTSSCPARWPRTTATPASP